jgi:hypothetical protein
MAHAVLERKEILYCVENEGIILGPLLNSERKADLGCINEVNFQKVNGVNNYAKYHEEFIPIKIVKRNFAFRNHGVY